MNIEVVGGKIVPLRFVDAYKHVGTQLLYMHRAGIDADIPLVIPLVAEAEVARQGQSIAIVGVVVCKRTRVGKFIWGF